METLLGQVAKFSFLGSGYEVLCLPAIHLFGGFIFVFSYNKKKTPTSTHNSQSYATAIKDTT